MCNKRLGTTALLVLLTHDYREMPKTAWPENQTQELSKSALEIKKLTGQLLRYMTSVWLIKTYTFKALLKNYTKLAILKPIFKTGCLQKPDTSRK